jgi:hypothetical protein
MARRPTIQSVRGRSNRGFEVGRNVGQESDDRGWTGVWQIGCDEAGRG